MVDVSNASANPVTAAAPAPANGMGGLMQMLMMFIQNLFGGAGSGLGDFFTRLMGGAVDDVAAAGASANGRPRENGRGPGAENSPSSPRSSVVNVPGDGRFSSARALAAACRDDAGEGHCAKGVANILEAQGYNINRADGHNWDRTLPQSGWVKLSGVDARHAPEGAVLVYNSDVQEGHRARNNGGGRFGHAEIVCYDANGERKYVSDKARDNFGGTVPDNFVGAYVPRERYNLMLAEQRRQATEPATTAVARNDSPTTGRNTSVAAAVDGQAIQTASLRTTFNDAQNNRQLAANTPDLQSPVLRQQLAPGMA